MCDSFAFQLAGANWANFDELTFVFCKVLSNPYAGAYRLFFHTPKELRAKNATPLVCEKAKAACKGLRVVLATYGLKT